MFYFDLADQLTWRTIHVGPRADLTPVMCVQDPGQRGSAMCFYKGDDDDADSQKIALDPKDQIL